MIKINIKKSRSYKPKYKDEAQRINSLKERELIRLQKEIEKQQK